MGIGIEGLTEAVKAAALGLGFDLVGVTGPEPFDDDRVRLQTWVNRGLHASLAYLARDPDLRADPGKVFPWLRSIVVVACSYGRGQNEGSFEDGAQIARFARGLDYHKPIRRRLAALEHALTRLSDRPLCGRSFVDTGPIMEKAAAHRAGLGFIGKNALLIHPRLGSYLFLGVLLTDLELQPDLPSAKSCGRCSLCVKACPTGALSTPYTLDATRCLSFLTIEERGTIPEELRGSIGPWAFGCDACQEVCPYNHQEITHSATGRSIDPGSQEVPPDRSATETPVLRKGIVRRTIDLADSLSIGSHEEFVLRFAGTPLMRPRREGFVRNACLAAARLGRTDLVGLLGQRLAIDPSPVVRIHAAWALGQLATKDARLLLEHLVRSESDPLVKREIETALRG